MNRGREDDDDEEEEEEEEGGGNTETDGIIDLLNFDRSEVFHGLPSRGSVGGSSGRFFCNVGSRKFA